MYIYGVQMRGALPKMKKSENIFGIFCYEPKRQEF